MATTQMTSKREVSFCVDTLLVQTVLGDDRMYKQAGVIGDLFTKVKEEIASHVDKQHPVQSVLKLLAPGAIWMFMQSIGLGKWGFFLGLLTDYFHVDIPGMIGSIFNGAKGLITSGNPISSDQIDNITNSVAAQHANETAPADDHKVYSSLELMDAARALRLALIDYEHQKLRLVKEGAESDGLVKLAGLMGKSTSILGKIIGWIFKIVLASAGLMVAGDVANTVMGNPSGLTGTYQEGRTPSSPAPVSSGPVSKQTKFPSTGDAPLPPTWPMVANEQDIENMVIDIAKQTYSGLDGKESIIRSTPGFKAVVNEIAWFNVHNEGTAVTMIPGAFSTRKHLVDYFIDDVAAASP